MSCTTVNSQSQVQARLPPLPAQLPTTQGQWTAFLNTLNAWAQALQQETHPPNVIPSQFQTFTTAAASSTVAALTASNCTPSVDATLQYYGAASLKVVISATGATLSFTGFPISMAAATRWFASFQIYAPSGCTGTLAITTGAGHTVSESFVVSSLAGWQQVWGLFDLRQYADTTATWQFTFTSTATVHIDGMQMNAIGDPIGFLPRFAGTQMVLGASAYAANLDGVPDGSTYERMPSANMDTNRRGLIDFTQTGHISKILDNIADGTTYARPLSGYLSNGRPYNYLGAYASGTTYHQGDEVSYGGNYYLYINATAASGNAPTNTSYWQLLGPTNLDNLGDGSTYLRMPGSNMDTNRRGLIDFTQAGHLSKNLDNIVDGSTYGRPLGSRLSSGKPWVDFSESINLNRHLGNIADAAGRFAGIQAAATGDGFQILSNPDFTGGSLTGYSVYDNNSTGHVTLSAVADSTTPNSSGYKMQVAVSATGESPGIGGWTVTLGPDSGPFAQNTYHKGSTIIWRIRANIPVGSNIEFASNGYGTQGTFNWLTSQAGTGGWFEYVAQQVIGTSGTFSSTGYFYLDTGTTPLDWYVAVCSAVCVTMPAGVGMPGSNMDSNRRGLIDFTQSGHLSKNVDNLADGATYGRPLLSRLSSGKPWIDFSEAIHANKILDNIADGTTYARYKSAGLTGGLADPSLGGIQAKGSIPPIVLGAAISWTTTTGALALSWSAFTIYRPDGTTTTIATGTQNITGLTNGTTYTIYPYIVDGQTTLSFATGKTGSAGTPAICYAGGSGPAAAACYANANIPLQSFVAAPSAGGGGGGGNQTGCLHPQTVVELADGRMVVAAELTDELLPGPDGPTRITHISRKPCGEWVRVRFRRGSIATVTTDHRFIRPNDEQVRAGDLHLGEIIAGRDGNVAVEALELVHEKSDMVMVNVEYPHLYYLAGALSHNGNPKP